MDQHPVRDIEKGGHDNRSQNSKDVDVVQFEVANVSSSSNSALTPDEKRLFDDNQVNLIPMPTADPRDPLNLPPARRRLAIAALCLFGAMAAAAELILGAMLPVFSFEYAGLNPKALGDIQLPAGSNGLSFLANFPGPPIWEIYLLASLPILMMGIANFFLIPLSIAVGRRAIILGCGVCAMAGCIWAGFSQSLGSHLAARTLQALGAGTVESLIPFIIQDLVFLHERNAAISLVFMTQGFIIVGLGISSPYIIIYLTWRWVYYITAICGVIFLVFMGFLLPETRYERSEAESRGIPAVPLRPGQQRPDLDFERYAPRTYASDMALFTGEFKFHEGLMALWDTFRTFFLPHIFFMTVLNSVMIAVILAAGYTVAAQLITAPFSWPFLHLGFCLFPIIIAAVASFVISGWGADVFANWMAKKKGRRSPDIQALNLLAPTLLGLIGCILFGYAGDEPERFGWVVFLAALSLIAFGFLGTNTIGVVYVLETYPHLAGPSLVNIASFRCLIAFILSFRVSEWVADWGYLRTFTLYACLLGASIAFIPIIYVWGEAWRKRWPALPKNRPVTQI